MNLEEETRKGYTISKEMKKVWAVELQLLNKLFEVCDKYNLRVFADGGTLLGVVREKGYIPWDDDIDMVLLRPDYDRLLEVAPKEFKYPFFFQNGNTDRFAEGLTKIRMEGTSGVLEHDIFRNCHQGIFIDVFPYDAVPDDTEKLDRLMRESGRKIQILRDYYRTSYSIFHPLRSWKRYKNYRYVESKGHANCFKEYEDMFRQFHVEDNEYVSCLAFQYDLEHFKRPRKWYDETVYLPFEDIMMPCPGAYHEILELQYGDYMTPAKAPSYHGGFYALDADRPYEEVIEEYKKAHKWDNWKHRRDLILNLLHLRNG